MKKFLISGLVLALSTALTATWAQSPKRADADNSAINAEIFYSVLIAELARVDAKTGEALSVYFSLARKMPSDQLFERALRLSLEMRDSKVARQINVEWIRLIPSSALAQHYLFEIDFAQKQYASGLISLSKWLEFTPVPERAAVLLNLSSYFSSIADKQASTHWLLKILQPYLADTAQLPAIKAAARLTLARSQVNAALFHEAMAQLRLLTTEAPASIDGWLLLGALELQENQFIAAEKSFHKFLQLAEKANLPTHTAGHVQAYLGLAQLTENRKDYSAAQNWLGKIEDDKERLSAQLRRASIHAKQGRLAEARLLIQQLPEQTTAQSRAKLIAEVGLMREHGQLNEAIHFLSSALVNAAADADLLYELSTLHEKAKNYEAMETLLKQVMTLRPNNSMAYNALGYSLADRSVRLEEAKTLIEKALAISPNDPYIMDSLAWTLYRMGHLNESLAKLQAAYKIRADAEIGAHLGEVLWQLKRKTESQKILKESHEIDADNPTLVETIKRLGVKL